MEILNQIYPYIIALIVAVLVAIIKAVTNALVEFIKTKQAEVIKRIGKCKYDENITAAKDIWNIVEEHYRITDFIGDSIQLKINMFNRLILDKIPGLTQSEVDYLRQAIAGEVNSSKAKIEKAVAERTYTINTTENIVAQPTAPTQ